MVRNTETDTMYKCLLVNVIQKKYPVEMTATVYLFGEQSAYMLKISALVKLFICAAFSQLQLNFSKKVHLSVLCVEESQERSKPSPRKDFLPTP